MLRLGYDAKRLFNNFTGLGNYSRTLVRNLVTYYPDNAYFLYTPGVTRNEETHFFLNSALFNVQRPPNRLGAYWRSYGVHRDLRKHKVQLYHGLSHELPVGLANTGIRTVVTIHDLIFKHYPAYYHWPDRLIYDMKFRYACRQADRIVAISESTKQDIIHFYDIADDKIEVIYQTCHERFMQEKSPKSIEAMRRRYGLPAEYLLYVGSIIPRKNLLHIAQALASLPAGRRLPLVVVGEGKAYKAQVLAFLQREGLANEAFFIRPAFEDLPALYQQASIFLYPSFYEGFGIPVLEALFSRTPVITSSVSSLPEAGGPASRLVDPTSPEAIANAIEEVLHDEALRDQMITQGYEYAQRFRGEPLTHQLMDLYESLLGQEYIGD